MALYKTGKNDTEKQWKRFVADVWKIIFSWSCPIWDLHLFLCWDHSFLNLSYLRTFWVSNIPRYFYFAFNSMESYRPEHLLVYYNFLKKIKSFAYVVNFRYSVFARPPFYCKWFVSIDNSVRRLLLLKIVLHYLFDDAIHGLRPNSAYADPFWLICGCSICIKKTFVSIQDGITFSRKWIPGHISVLHVKVSLLQRENIKKSKIRSAYECYFRK